MKKKILVCAFASIYMSSFAQNNTSQEHKKNDNTNKNCAMKMENGKMMMTMDEKTVIMDKEMTLKNGTVIMMDGTVKMKDGKAIQLKEGDCMDMTGKMILVKNSQIKKDSRKEH